MSSSSATVEKRRSQPGRRNEAPIRIVPSPKRVRTMFHGRTLADSLSPLLVLEQGHLPVYYFPPADLRMDLLTRTDLRTHCPLKGDASYWSIHSAERTAENAAWSYEDPFAEVAQLAGAIAFYWDKVDHWFEEDEEIFGHPRDPYHRIDVRASSREVRVELAGERVALTRRALFLFETGLATRYYIPREDVQEEWLIASRTRTTCPYKGHASYWSLRVNDSVAEDAVWAYRDPLPECPRIKGHYCFYPEKVDLLYVEGDVSTAP